MASMLARIVKKQASKMDRMHIYTAFPAIRINHLCGNFYLDLLCRDLDLFSLP
jgi:hypothetical protein